jgi:hypothetical protein
MRLLHVLTDYFLNLPADAFPETHLCGVSLMERQNMVQ